MARDCGKTINELLGWRGPLTERQFLVWQEWELLDTNHYTKTEYAMYRVAQVWGGGNLEDYPVKIVLKEVTPLEPKKMTKHQRKFYEDYARDAEKWKGKGDVVAQNMLIAAIGAKPAQ